MKQRSRLVEPRTLKGFRDFLPEQAIKREYLVEKIRQVFERWGFDPIETPALEYLETFEGQIGEEEKLFYKFQDAGGRRVALRYDQTVPAARVVAQYQNEITLPFKRYQIQTVWRAENPQKGRYREFLQCDADIFGVDSPQADAEVIALSLEIYQSLGFSQIKTLINDRALLKNLPYPIITALDKLKKIGEDGVISAINQKGFSEKEAKNYLEAVKSLQLNETLQAIFDYLDAAGFPKDWYQFEPTLARSFSYSSGPIWEIEVPEFEGGSVLGGERYDKLVGAFATKDIPGTGFGLGFDRTLEAAEQFGLLPAPKTKTQVLVTIFSQKLLNDSIKLAGKLRAAGINTDLYPDASVKLDKQIKYADRKGIPSVAILGEEEIQLGVVTLKNMETGKQEKLSFEGIVDRITRT